MYDTATEGLPCATLLRGGLGHIESSCLGSSLGVGVGGSRMLGSAKREAQGRGVALPLHPCTENQETWVPSGAPFLAGERPQVVAQLLPPALGPLCLCWWWWWWWGCSRTPMAPGNRLPRNDQVVECVVSERRPAPGPLRVQRKPIKATGLSGRPVLCSSAGAQVSRSEGVAAKHCFQEGPSQASPWNRPDLLSSQAPPAPELCFWRVLRPFLLPAHARRLVEI